MVNIRPRLVIPRRLPAILFALLLVGSLAAAAPPATDAYTYVKVSSLGKAIRADRVVVSRVGINLPIRYGVIGGTVREHIAYHYPGTSWPGGHSNTYLYAHARTGSFLALWKVRVGDIVSLHLINGAWVKYRVTISKRVALERRALDAAHVVGAGDAPDVHGQHEDRRPLRGGRRPGLLSARPARSRLRLLSRRSRLRTGIDMRSNARHHALYRRRREMTRLGSIIEDRDITYAALAGHARLQPRTVRMLATGETPLDNVTVGTIRRIASALSRPGGRAPRGGPGVSGR